MSTWQSFNLQNANSFIMQNMIYFHDFCMTFIIMITSLILFIIIKLINNKMNNKFIIHNQTLEIIWTFIPMLILIFLAMPSLKLLYMTDEVMKPCITVKSMGHQWYWSYEYSDFNNIEFNSYMLNNKKNNLFRLLDVDNHMIIPYKNEIRILVSSDDVIHSWTVPSLGIKLDSIPGRINQTFLIMNRPGLFFGQCSEICGMNHSFMPIVIESTSKKKFINWILQ